MRPLTNLLKKETEWQWGEKESGAFHTLVDRLCTAPVLTFPKFDEPFLLSTDASNTGIGAILKQHDEQGKEKVIAYTSRTLNKPEQNYSTTEKEMFSNRLRHLPVPAILVWQRIHDNHGSLRSMLSHEVEKSKW